MQNQSTCLEFMKSELVHRHFFHIPCITTLPFAVPAPLGKPFFLPSAASPSAGLQALASSFPYLHTKCCQRHQALSIPVPILPMSSLVKWCSVVSSFHLPPSPPHSLPQPGPDLLLSWALVPPRKTHFQQYLTTFESTTENPSVKVEWEPLLISGGN